MRRVALLAATLLLLPTTSLAKIVVDPVEAHLERELWELEHERDDSLHHFGHHRKHFLGLLGHRSRVQAPSDGPQLLADGNPAVVGKLDRMDQDVQHVLEQEVMDRQHSAADARSTLEGDIQGAIKHENSIANIRSQMAKTEVQIRAEEHKLKRLEADRWRLDMTHRSLSSSLHRILDPKIKHAEERLQKKKHKVQDLEARDAEWKEKEEKFHATALAMLDERRKSKAELESALISEERAHQERKAAEKRYGTVKKDTTFNIEGYQYSQAEEKAAMAKEMRGEEEASQAEGSVKRLSHIFTVEQQRLDESMAKGEDRVQQKMRELEEANKESTAKLAKLRHDFADWQAEEQTWDTRLSANRQNTRVAAQDYSNAKEAMLASASDQEVLDAKMGSDWAWDEYDWGD